MHERLTAVTIEVGDQQYIARDWLDDFEGKFASPSLLKPFRSARGGRRDVPC